MKKLLNYFTKFEIGLWNSSVLIIVATFIIFEEKDYLTLIASLIGATFLILNAKGNPLGQFLTIVFSLLYGIISYRFDYYGEMITYLCMSMPIAIIALISWLKNPYKGNKSEVATDYVVLSLGAKSENALYNELNNAGINTYLIGDAEKVGRIADATRSAFECVKKI